jgi:uncharacterized protein YcgL (UPF0745 family)
VRAAALVAEIVGDWGEGTFVLLLLLSSRKLLLHVVSDKLLCLNLRDLGCSLNLSFEEELLFKEVRKSGVERV